MSCRPLFLAAAALLIAGAVCPAQAVTDARGQSLVLAQPAQRIVALAPSITELLFAAGAGDRVVGVAAYSDYPAAARQLPVVGTSARLDIERVLALRPDLVIAWQTGTSTAEVERLERLGLRVFVVEPRRLADIPRLLRELGSLAGSGMQADAAAAAFAADVQALRERYGHRTTVSVFLQIDDRPLLTLNDAHIVGDVLAVCGGRNVFGDQPLLVPRVGVEDVLHADPDAILVAMADAGRALADWRPRRTLRAVRQQHLFTLSPDLISRPGPRLIAGVREVCTQIDRVRARKKP